MRKLLILLTGLLMLVPSIGWAQLNTNTLPPECAMSSMVGGSCVPLRQGVRARASSATIGDCETAGTATITCEYDGSNWIAMLPGTYGTDATFGSDLTVAADPSGGNAGAKNEFIGLPRISMAALGAMGNGPVISEPITPTAALCAPVGGGTESDDGAIYRDTVTDVTSYEHLFVADVGAGEGFDCIVTGHAVVNTASVGFWFRSDTVFDAGDLEINLLDAAIVEGDGDLPEYATAGVWQWMEVDVAADCVVSGCADIDGVELLTTAVSPETFNNATVYMDSGAFWLAACEETLGAAIPYDGVLAITAGVTAGGDSALLAEGTDYIVHYQTGNDAVCMITNQSANYGLVLYTY